MDKEGSETVTITVEVRTWLSSETAAHLSESFTVPARSLEDTLRVLSRFHELAERIRDEQAGLKK